MPHVSQGARHSLLHDPLGGPTNPDFDAIPDIEILGGAPGASEGVTGVTSLPLD